MIICDYSAISISAIVATLMSEGERATEVFCRHVILNSFRSSYKLYKREYGPTVCICCDGGKSWRKGLFEHYKANRKKGREESDIDWDMVYGIVDQMKQDFKLFFPYHVFDVPGAEADDIIGALARKATMKMESSIIISSDKDFFQLHSPYVCQWRPLSQQLVRVDNPGAVLKEQIIRGDSGDGVPNILSPDNAFVDKIRQKPITQKRLELYMNADPNTIEDLDVRRNFFRNINMIDLTKVPEEIMNEIDRAINTEEAPLGNQTTIMQYLGENRMRVLLDKVSDFT